MALLQLINLLAMAGLLALKLLAIPAIKLGVIVCLLFESSTIVSLTLLPLAKELCLATIGAIAQVCVLLIALCQLTMVTSLHIVHLIEMDVLGVRSLPLLSLDLVLKLLNLLLEALLELFLHLGVLFQFLSVGGDLDLKLLTSIVALAEHGLVLSHVLFEVVEDLQFLVEGDQSIQLVLKFILALFQKKLQS